MASNPSEKRIVPMKDFKHAEIPLENLFLDPNNPRFTTGKKYKEKHITNPKVQNYCKDQLRNGGDIGELCQSIIASGYVSVDRIVVKEIESDPGCYVVLEGNRRVCASKTVLEDYDTGGDVELENLIPTLKKIPSLIYIGTEDVHTITARMQGLRHITGPKQWGPFAQAKHINNLITEEQLEPKDIHGLIGVSPNKVNQDQRAFNVYEQSKKEFKDEFPEIEDHNNFSMFVESVGKAKEWHKFFDFDVSTQKCNNKIRLESFVKAITSKNENTGIPIVPKAIDLRILTKALKEEKSELVEEVFDSERTIDEVKSLLGAPISKGALDPIIKRCEDAVEQLGKINTDHYRQEGDKIKKIIDKLNKAIEAVQDRISPKS